MLLLRIVYSVQMKQGSHLFLLTAKCFLQEAKSRWEVDVRKDGPQCDISGLCECLWEIYSAPVYIPESKFWPETRVKCTLCGCSNCWEKWMVSLPPSLIVWLNLWEHVHTHQTVLLLLSQMTTAFTTIFKSSVWHEKLMRIYYAPLQTSIINTDFAENFHQPLQRERRTPKFACHRWDGM
jgi:hypothetical protein